MIHLSCALFLAALQAQEPPRNRAPLFENWTEKAGLPHGPAMRVAFADLDGDGRPDVVLDRTRILLNRSGLLREQSPLLPETARRPASVQFGDVNGDGRLDLAFLFCTDLADPKFDDDGRRNEIRLGDGRGGFVPQPDCGLGAAAETSTTACFLDYDRDGNLDLFVGAFYVAYGKGLESFPSRLYRGRGDGTFEDVTERAGLLGVAEPGRRDSRRPVYGVTHTDWNNDGFQDILAASYGRQWNRLWRNNGDGTFADVGPETTFDGDEERSGVYADAVKKRFKKDRAIDLEDEAEFRANGNTFDVAVADFDGDGDMDCFLAEITHWWAGPSSDRSMLLANLGAGSGFRFRREPDRIRRRHAVENWNQGDLHAGWLDVDNDGLLDLLIASSDYPDDQILRLYRQGPDGSFEEWTDRLGFRWINASQISLGDFDRDGATDILVGTHDARLTPEQAASRPLQAGLFRNVAARAAGNGFFNVRLEGQAVGARVTIWIGGRRQVREVYGGLGHAGHRDDTDCRFGVGKAARIARVEVRWPDGTTQVFDDVEANRFTTLEKGGGLKEAGP